MNRNPGWARARWRSLSASSRRPGPDRPARPRCGRRRRSSSSIAMSQRTPSHWSAIALRVLDHGGPQLRVRTHSAGRRRARPGSTGRARWPAPGPPTRDERSRVLLQVLLGACDEQLGSVVSQGWSGATWLGTKSRIRADPRAASAVARSGQALRAAQVVVDDVVADAVRRADDVRGCQSGSAAAKLGRQVAGSTGRWRCRPGCVATRPSTRRRRIPASAIPSQYRSGTAEVDAAALVPAQFASSHGHGVDLVDQRVRRRQAQWLGAAHDQRCWLRVARVSAWLVDDVAGPAGRPFDRGAPDREGR